MDFLLLCERTSLKKIVKISKNDKDEEVSKTFNCVTAAEEMKPDKETSTTIKVSEEPDHVHEVTTTTTITTTTESNHKEFCKDQQNFQFNGKMECEENKTALNCHLSCPEGMEPDIKFANPYKCSFVTGIISPAVPKCLLGMFNLFY